MINWFRRLFSRDPLEVTRLRNERDNLRAELYAIVSSCGGCVTISDRALVTTKNRPINRWVDRSNGRVVFYTDESEFNRWLERQS